MRSNVWAKSLVVTAVRWLEYYGYDQVIDEFPLVSPESTSAAAMLISWPAILFQAGQFPAAVCGSVLLPVIPHHFSGRSITGN